MNLLHPSTLEERIITLLTEKPYTTTELFRSIQTQQPCTKQGFYKALRNLGREEIILLYKKNVSLDTVWLRKMQDLFSRIYTIHSDEMSFDILNLEDNENVSYVFTTIRNLDTFWGHLQNILLRKTDSHDPVFSYDPHYWFYIVRKEREKELLREIVERKRQFLMTVADTYPLDKLVKNDFNNDYLQYNYKKIFSKQNYYITTTGEYIIEVILDSRICDKIDQIYKKAQIIDVDLITSLNSLLTMKSNNKMKISRNKRKALTLQKRMRKDFYIITYTHESA